MRTLSINMTDRQYDVLSSWAKSEYRDVENLFSMFAIQGLECYKYSHELCVLKTDDDRDPSGSERQYYSDDELEEILKTIPFVSK